MFDVTIHVVTLDFEGENCFIDMVPRQNAINSRKTKGNVKNDLCWKIYYKIRVGIVMVKNKNAEIKHERAKIAQSESSYVCLVWPYWGYLVEMPEWYFHSEIKEN